MKVLKWIKNNIFLVIIGIILCAYVLTVVGSLLWALGVTLKKYPDFVGNPLGFPKQIIFDNWIEAVKTFKAQVQVNNLPKDYYIEWMLLFSLIYAVGCSFAATVTACVSAYLTAKYKFKFSKIVYLVVIVAMILPIVGALPSEIQMLRFLGLYDTYIGIFIMKANFLGMYFLVFYATFKSLSWTYAESAFMDGAGHFTVMIRIMLPLVKTTFLAVFLLNFIVFWNDYQGPMLYLPSKPTMAFGLFYMRFANTSDFGREPMQITGCMLVALPVIILFCIFQKQLVGNLTVGGIKG